MRGDFSVGYESVF